MGELCVGFGWTDILNESYCAGQTKSDYYYFFYVQVTFQWTYSSATRDVFVHLFFTLLKHTGISPGLCKPQIPHVTTCCHHLDVSITAHFPIYICVHLLTFCCRTVSHLHSHSSSTPRLIQKELQQPHIRHHHIEGNSVAFTSSDNGVVPFVTSVLPPTPRWF